MMAFDLDDEELEMTRTKLHHLKPKDENKDKIEDLSSNNLGKKKEVEE